MSRRGASAAGCCKRFGVAATFYDPRIGAGIDA
jgi:hypothetical protein